MEQKSEIVLYQPEGAVSLEVRLENETVWLTQQQISELFGTCLLYTSDAADD